MKVTVLGAGAWGTAIAVAASARNEVLLWARGHAAAAIEQARENTQYLPGVALPPALRIESNFDAAVAHAGDGLLLVAVPMAALRGVLQRLPSVQPVLWLCKGFESGSGALGHEVAREL